MNDIVYFVKESRENEELRYSLRTIKNFPHDKVYFNDGLVGQQIRDKFPNSCKYERS